MTDKPGLDEQMEFLTTSLQRLKSYDEAAATLCAELPEPNMIAGMRKNSEGGHCASYDDIILNHIDALRARHVALQVKSKQYFMEMCEVIEKNDVLLARLKRLEDGLREPSEGVVGAGTKSLLAWGWLKKQWPKDLEFPPEIASMAFKAMSAALLREGEK